MKRYALFVFCAHQPEGGMNDFVGDFDTTEEARTAAAAATSRFPKGYWQVWDMQDNKQAESGQWCDPESTW